jgi:hypothetical protein
MNCRVAAAVRLRLSRTSATPRRRMPPSSSSPSRRFIGEISAKFQASFRTFRVARCNPPDCSRTEQEQVMAIEFAQSTDRNAATHLPSRLIGWLTALPARCGALNTIGATRLNDLTDGQLDEIGMRRMSRGVRWLDCRESSLGIDFEYRSAPRDREDGRFRG